ncbi:MAG: S8 family serine peptidase [Planctomycetota bacterium]|nr:S8 family serine peptidase [Planctomycetota bacterium]
MLNRLGRASGTLAVSIAASVVFSGLESTNAYAVSKQDGASKVPTGYELDRLYIRFKDAITPEEGMARLSDVDSPDHLSIFKEAQWHRSTGDLKQSDVAAMHHKAEKKLGRELPNPWQGVYVTLVNGSGAAEAIAGVKKTGFANKVLPVPMVSSMPLLNVGDFQEEQGYLQPGFNQGIGAEEVWNRYDIAGEGVSVCDIEYNFDPMHCDLPEVQELGPLCPHPNGPHHGTAAIGCVAALNNGSGTTGIAHAVDQVYFSPGVEIIEHEGEEHFRGIIDRAIFQAVMNLEPGDVLFFEVGITGPNWNGNPHSDLGTVPLEWYEPYYDAIVIAVANDIIVVEPAANGYENLDDPVYSQGNDGHWPFLLENDSGAIMVGAGNTRPWNARQRASFSNYGATVDVHGWGWNVMTTGYGQYAGHGTNCTYTSGFNGTSSASAIVAGAAVLLQSYYKNRWNSTLTPADLKWILRETGQPQQVDDNEVLKHIGPLPDLIAATDFLESLTPLHRVPEDHDTIQEAVDAAGNGDTILVGPGSWNGFEVENKNLLIQSTDGSDTTYIDGAGVGSCVRCLDSSVQIEGFTIQNCRAADGAGIYAQGDELTAKACLFRDNTATVSGGGIWTECEKTNITDCTFMTNRAWFAGAGIHTRGEEANVWNCTFEQNNADHGGGMSNRSDRCSVMDCLFLHNEARFTGGGLDLWHGDNTVQGCFFEGNNSNKGGGLCMAHTAEGTVNGCDFYMNTADLLGAGCWLEDVSPRFEQCRFSKNIALNSGGAIQCDELANPEIASSILCGNVPGHINGDFQDQGDNCFADACDDADGDGVLDECQVVPGDINGDGEVAVDDILAVIAAFGPCDGCPEDVNGDGTVDVNDLLQVLNCWNGAC